MEITGPDINTRVKLQYEAYPYPDYSLFLPLQAQEAYASHSLFLAQLLREKNRIAPVAVIKDARILIAGCGDVLPYVLSFWEPKSHRIHAVDLSQRNIQRARLRSLFRPHAFSWQPGNLEDPQFPWPHDVAHVDSYGVLHHLANPSLVLGHLHNCMLPGATMRVMVYNREARSWIHHLQRAFALLGLSAFDRRDLDRAVAILQQLERVSPALQARLQPMKTSIFNHASRFVDTFFHAREARLSLDYWLDTFAKSGLETLGLFDRYAELDDLENPLLRFPKAADLRGRMSDRRFENNLEIFLVRPAAEQAIPSLPRTAQALPVRWRYKMPPKAWFSYTETSKIPWATRYQLWSAFLRTVSGEQDIPKLDTLAKKIPAMALQRLARLGGLFPSNFASHELKALLIAPLHARMEAPNFRPSVNLRQDRELRRMVEQTLRSKTGSIRHWEAIFNRLDAAQRP